MSLLDAGYGQDTRKRVAIVGSRQFSDYEVIEPWILFAIHPWDILEVVSGGAPGVDYIAEVFARKHNLLLKVFPAEWNLHGKKAGLIRNRLIVENSDIVLAFPDSESVGTLHTINLAREMGKQLFVFQIEALKNG